jgi:hypothetical protein
VDAESAFADYLPPSCHDGGQHGMVASTSFAALPHQLHDKQMQPNRFLLVLIINAFTS